MRQNEKKSHWLRAAVAAIAGLLLAGTASAAVPYSNGFEVDNSGWNEGAGTDNATRVASGTNGITSKTGSFHAEVAGSNNGQTTDDSAFTRWGGYSSTFGPGFVTSVDIYLKFGTVNDTRFDWDAASNDSTGNFRRDFVFNGGYYNDTDVTGNGSRFVFSASNNATRGSAFPKNPARDPFAIVDEGWYTFQHKFYDDGGLEKTDLSILDSSGLLLHSWTLSDVTDLTATAGGNRYGWFVFNELPFLAIDNTSLTALPEPGAMSVLGLMALPLLRRSRRK